MSTQDSPQTDGRKEPLDLSTLAGFQFGPSWARKEPERSSSFREEAPARHFGGRRSDDSEGTRGGARRRVRTGGQGERGERRPRRFDGAGADARRSGGRRPFTQDKKPVREHAQPTPGLRVELRPADAALAVFEQEIRKHKRTISVFELAQVIMADKKRYDLVFMRQEQEGGPALIVSKKGDGACWLERREALAYLWRAPWFAEYYTTEQQEISPPKGTFTAVARCGLSGELIGPVNWHGYQAALIGLHRSQFAHMDFERFREKVVLEKSEEALAEWLEKASHRTVWKPVRSGAEAPVLEDKAAVEKDFDAHHFDEVYSVANKVFINGATSLRLLAPGLASHAVQIGDRHRRIPKLLIPNLCHGLARHQMAIFKWNGQHYTGPSRIRSVPADTVLADRMNAILEWVRAHQGKRMDQMFAELSGVTGEDKAKAAAAYAPYAADTLWLMEQGLLLVMRDGGVWFPRAGASAPLRTTASKTTDTAAGGGGDASPEKSPDAPLHSASEPVGKLDTAGEAPPAHEGAEQAAEPAPKQVPAAAMEVSSPEAETMGDARGEEPAGADDCPE